MRRLSVALVLAATCQTALAEEATQRAMLDQLHAEYCVCVAFYSIRARCSADAEAGRRLGVITRRADALAGALAMTRQDAALRLDLNLAALAAFAGEDCRGLDTLDSRFSPQCDPLSAGRE
jgi:hypothetical protein